MIQSTFNRHLISQYLLIMIFIMKWFQRFTIIFLENNQIKNKNKKQKQKNGREKNQSNLASKANHHYHHHQFFFISLVDSNSF